MKPSLAFNTAVSFMTNTNWQAYGGETTLSYFSQMVGLTFQNFVSAAVGHGRAGRAHPRPRAAFRLDHRQLLGRPHARRALHPPAALAGRRRLPGLPGRRPELRLLQDSDRRSRARSSSSAIGPGRLAGRDQAAGHERRRLLQRELRPPAREPDGLVQPGRVARDPLDPGRPGLHVRQDGGLDPPRLGRASA